MENVQGFSQALKAHGLKKVAWLSLGFLGVILTIYHSYSIITSYQRYPFVTKFSMMPQDELLFPLVAISTTRTVNCNKLESQLEKSDTLSETWFVSHCWLYHSSMCEGNRSDLIQKCNSTINGELVEWGNSSEPNVERSLNVMNTLWKRKIFNHPEDFVVQIKWNGKVIPLENDCLTSEFCVFLYHGSLQFIVNFFGRLKSDKIGNGNGLEITLKVPQANPAGHGVLNDMDGFIIDFFPPKHVLGAKRTVVQPGTSVSLSLKEVQHKKLPAPFESDCIHSWNETFLVGVTKNILQDFDQNFIVYHQEYCHAICRTNHLKDKCNCTWAKVNPLEDVDRGSYQHLVPKCKEYDSHVWNCITKNDLDLNGTLKLCNCQEACEINSYDVTVSSSKWPSTELWQNLGKELEILHMNYTKPTDPISQTMMKNEVSGQLARVTIFFDSNQRIVIEEIAKFKSFWAFFVTWGGAMSIYLGISVMTLFEFILSLCEKMLCLLNVPAMAK